MKVLLVVASLVAVASAGVGVLNAREAAEAFRLYKAYCSGVSDQGSDGSTFVYCKRPREELNESVQHRIQLTPPPQAPKQVVFVQTPVTNYRHNVVVTGDAGQQQQTTIYVLPQKDTHTLDYTDNRDVGRTPLKPSLYFLNNTPGDFESGIVSAQALKANNPNAPGYTPRARYAA